jgi:tetratricopeptide (TPR) repeat protein
MTLETAGEQAVGALRAGGKMKKSLKFAAVVFVLSLCAVPGWAQVMGTIKGVAKDEAGKPIAGATVEITNPEKGKKYEAKTNNAGEYASPVEPGKYTVTLMQNNAPVLQFNGVPVTPDKESPVDFDLAKNKPALTEEQRKKMESAQKEHEKIKSLNATLQQAKELEGQGNYDQAVTLLQQATQVDPNQDLIWGYLGDAQRGAKKYPDAIESYQKALAIKNLGPYHGGLADALVKSGQTDKGIQEYATAAQVDPTNAATYYFNEGAVLTNLGKIDDALAAFDKALQLDPNRAAAYYWKGVNMIGKATMKDNKMVAPPGTSDAFNKYLELEPTGKYADAAKQMLATIGATVETSYGKGKSAAKKK